MKMKSEENICFKDGALIEYIPKGNVMGSLNNTIYYHNTPYRFMIISSRKGFNYDSFFYKAYCFEYNLIEELMHTKNLKILVDT